MRVGSPQAGAVVEQREQDRGTAIERCAAAGHGSSGQLGAAGGAEQQAKVGRGERCAIRCDLQQAEPGAGIGQLDCHAGAVDRRGNAGRGQMDRRKDLSQGRGRADVNRHDDATPERDIEVRASDRADASPMVQHRERGAWRQCVEATGVDHVRAGAADEPGELHPRQRIDLEANRQLAVRQRETRVARLVQRVAAQATVDRVCPGAAGDHVVARAADQYVGQSVADDGVGERRAGHVAETREFAEVGRHPACEVHDDRGACGAEIQRVDPRPALQDLDRGERQAVRCRFGNIDHREAAAGQHGHRDVRRHGGEVDRVDALAVVAARGFGEGIHAPVVGEDVGVVADPAGHRVGAEARGDHVVEFVPGDLVVA